jgi:hypothetical protein
MDRADIERLLRRWTQEAIAEGRLGRTLRRIGARWSPCHPAGRQLSTTPRRQGRRALDPGGCLRGLASSSSMRVWRTAMPYHVHHIVMVRAVGGFLGR